MSPTYVLGIFRGLGLVQPLLQQRLQLAHVLEAQLQGLEAADGRLAEHLTCNRKAMALKRRHTHAEAKRVVWGGLTRPARLQQRL